MQLSNTFADVTGDDWRPFSLAAVTLVAVVVFRVCMHLA